MATLIFLIVGYMGPCLKCAIAFGTCSISSQRPELFSLTLYARARGYKKFTLNLAEDEILNARKNKSIKKLSFLQAQISAIFPAHNWDFNIYEMENFILS